MSSPRPAHDQAGRLGAEIVVGSEMLETWPECDGSLALELVNGAVVEGRSLIGAMGSQYRRLEAPGVDELIGAGVYYGSAPSDALFHRDGDVFIVGGANSAGQAALHAAEFARSVTLLVRGPSLSTRCRGTWSSAAKGTRGSVPDEHPVRAWAGRQARAHLVVDRHGRDRNSAPTRSSS